jgi:hypothetical protein
MPALLESLDEVEFPLGKDACEYRKVLWLDMVRKRSRGTNSAI